MTIFSQKDGLTLQEKCKIQEENRKFLLLLESEGIPHNAPVMKQIRHDLKENRRGASGLRAENTFNKRQRI